MRDGVRTKIAELVRQARSEGRRSLLETEGLEIARALGWTVPPSVLVRDSAEAGARGEFLDFPGRRVVVKVVSARIAHKTDIGGVRDVAKTRRDVVEAVRSMERRFADDEVVGYSINRHVEFDRALGGELLAGVRRTFDFGPVVTLALGGVLAEHLAAELAPGRGVAVFSPVLGTRERIVESLDRKTLTPLVLGTARGTRARLDPQGLTALLSRLLDLAGEIDRLGIGAFEINPLALTAEGPVALDCLVELVEPPESALPERPLDKLRCLLEPRSVAIVGVSDAMNPGRIILENLLREGFPRERIHVVKPGRETISGCRCYPDFEALPVPVDVAVLGVDASQVPEMVQRLVDGRRAETMILIPGGLGEREGTDRRVRRLRDLLAASRRSAWRGPLINGGNCLGIRSVPSRFDTLFIPDHKLPRPSAPPSPVAIVSQSGAFAVARLSKLAGLNPRYLISIGNQLDLTVGDYLEYLADDPQLELLAFYVEGFRPLDGVRWLAAAERAVAAGKTLILYRAGRTPAGALASASHTAALAGDYVVTRELAAASGVVVAEELEDFDELTATFCGFLGKPLGGRRLGAVSNAGFECVAIADHLGRCELADFLPGTGDALEKVLRSFRLEAIVGVRNPLDVTPILSDEPFETVVRAVLDDEGVDLGLVGCVPLTAALETTEASAGSREDLGRPSSIVQRLARLHAASAKPFVVVVDAGPRYDAMARELQSSGVPTFRTVDRAMRAVNRVCDALLRRVPARS